MTTPSGTKSKLILWFKRLGLAGFLFFFIKGLVWLAVIWLGVDFLEGCGSK
ncbi:MAG: hypothetical protein RMK52_01225 [Chitinophagales bacterium]|nr:hypothetical protein [Chitinophagales bacterium]MDW8392847.1 hypothetical protein [Chitinophagales bacterium]